MCGMMFRSWRTLGADGMLFTFSREARWGVEMPFCESMDVVFFDAQCRVVDVQHATPWSRDPRTWKIYRPREKCRYVLELPPGCSFRTGDQARLNL